MNQAVVINIFRFLGLLLLQVFILRQINLGDGFMHNVVIFVYPIFILLAPLRMPQALLLFLAFLMGFTVDIFYDSLGVHAGASLLTAFVRPLVLSFLEPRGGYTTDQSPTKRQLGITWFVSYAAILMFVHILYFFILEVFTFVYFGKILLRTLVAYGFSMVFVMLHQFLFNPKE